MNLYVPEIGDEIRLTEDWKFSLHAEDRNRDLGVFFRRYLYGYNEGWIEEEKLPPMRQPDYEVKYPTDEELQKMYGYGKWGKFPYEQKQKAYKEAEDACPEYVKYWADNAAHREAALKILSKEIEVTIPAGTVLAIDRIYIRKGASDYSSITFYAKGLGEVVITERYAWRSQKPKKKKALRFWAKLEDCNKIQFEKI